MLTRRTFLRFLGVGMAAATLTPGQLIAEVSRPLLVPVGASGVEIVLWPGSRHHYDALTNRVYAFRSLGFDLYAERDHPMRLEGLTA